MCGGNLEFSEGDSCGTCESCGSTMTLPKANDERMLNLFNRANHYRMQSQFDKALKEYENILEEDTGNAEAYWGCVLSRYGIEYVEDARTHERIPTCHRVQNESILADLDYQNALKYSPDDHSRELYKTEAQRISEIQKGILNIARNEKPYDIFICYKETDSSSGERTIDSTLAQDIYYQLTNEGYKVFFARITLEDKLGQEYEPYIFAALNSAKVMLVIGTKAEYYNAVWVKNEWARFLEIAKKDKKKLLIPCYRDMDAYELPEELSLFQSQDMSKIGFIQDLIRGIKKIVSNDVPEKTVYVQSETAPGASMENLIKRATMALEDGEYDSAQSIIDKMMDIDPENAKAQIFSLMVEFKLGKESDFLRPQPSMEPLNRYNKFNRAYAYASDEYKNELREYLIASSNNYCDMLTEEMMGITSAEELAQISQEIDDVPDCERKEAVKAKIVQINEECDNKKERTKKAIAVFKRQQDLAEEAVKGYNDKSTNIGCTCVLIPFIISLVSFFMMWFEDGGFWVDAILSVVVFLFLYFGVFKHIYKFADGKNSEKLRLAVEEYKANIRAILHKLPEGEKWNLVMSKDVNNVIISGFDTIWVKSGNVTVKNNDGTSGRMHTMVAVNGEAVSRLKSGKKDNEIFRNCFYRYSNLNNEIKAELEENMTEIKQKNPFAYNVDMFIDRPVMVYGGKESAEAIKDMFITEAKDKVFNISR